MVHFKAFWLKIFFLVYGEILFCHLGEHSGLVVSALEQSGVSNLLTQCCDLEQRTFGHLRSNTMVLVNNPEVYASSWHDC